MSKTDWTRTHLCQILRAYADYYKRVRTHLSLEKDAPLGRPVQAIGSLATVPLLGGLSRICPDGLNAFSVSVLPRSTSPRSGSRRTSGECFRVRRLGVEIDRIDNLRVRGR